MSRSAPWSALHARLLLRVGLRLAEDRRALVRLGAFALTGPAVRRTPPTLEVARPTEARAQELYDRRGPYWRGTQERVPVVETGVEDVRSAVLVRLVQHGFLGSRDGARAYRQLELRYAPVLDALIHGRGSQSPAPPAPGPLTQGVVEEIWAEAAPKGPARPSPAPGA